MIVQNWKEGKKAVFLEIFVRLKANYKLQFAVTTSKKRRYIAKMGNNKNELLCQKEIVKTLFCILPIGIKKR